ncbi:MAG: CsbD family protein [Pararhizobium sp.]
MTSKRSDAAPTDAGAKTAAAREAKGSVQEAIGKLIGDDAATARGTAEKEAGAADAADIRTSSRP